MLFCICDFSPAIRLRLLSLASKEELFHLNFISMCFSSMSFELKCSTLVLLPNVWLKWNKKKWWLPVTSFILAALCSKFIALFNWNRWKKISPAEKSWHRNKYVLSHLHFPLASWWNDVLWICFLSANLKKKKQKQTVILYLILSPWSLSVFLSLPPSLSRPLFLHPLFQK